VSLALRGFFGALSHTKFFKILKYLRRVHYRRAAASPKPRIGLRVQPLKDNDCSTASGQVAHNPDDQGVSGLGLS
jgi:hypothetical protein